MSESYEIKKAKIDSLVTGFTNDGYKPTNRIGQGELLQFLNKRTSTGLFDQFLSEKLFQVLSLDHMSTLSVEEFINGYLQFEEDIKRNAELFNMKLSQEQEIYENLEEQCRRYKSEKLNSEGLCENAKVYGEITDIDIKKKLEGIKEIIIKLIYNEKSEELHFKMGDINSNEMLNKSFEFKPTSRKDHFEFIMKGINDRNQIFDIGSKVFPLTDVNSHEEYLVQIVVPELDNEEEIAAYIHAKIVLYWSDYKYYEKQRKKAESRIKKLTNAMNKAAEYLRKIREIYGDLTKKKPDLIVDFNNEKLMQRKGTRLNVNFNNEKEAMAPGGKYMVEFNNQREIKRSSAPIRVEFNNSKEVIQETQMRNINIINRNININEQKENMILSPDKEGSNDQDTLSPQIQLNQQNELNIQREINEQKDLSPQNDVLNGQANENGEQINMRDVQVVTSIKEPIIEGEHINEPIISIQNNEDIVNNLGSQPAFDQNIITQSNGATEQYNFNEINNYNQNQYTNFDINQNDINNVFGSNVNMNGEMGVTTTETEGTNEANGELNFGGLETTDNNTNIDFTNLKDIVNETQVHTSITRASVHEVTNKPMFSENVLPVKVLPEKVNKVIIDSNVSSRPIIYGGKKVTYANYEESNNYINNLYQNNQGFNQGLNQEFNQGFNLENFGNNNIY